MKHLITVTLLVALKAASFGQNTTNFAHIGRIDRFETEINQLIPKDAKIEVLCGGFEWSSSIQPPTSRSAKREGK